MSPWREHALERDAGAPRRNEAALAISLEERLADDEMMREAASFEQRDRPRRIAEAEPHGEVEIGGGGKPLVELLQRRVEIGPHEAVDDAAREIVADGHFEARSGEEGVCRFKRGGGRRGQAHELDQIRRRIVAEAEAGKTHDVRAVIGMDAEAFVAELHDHRREVLRGFEAHKAHARVGADDERDVGALLRARERRMRRRERAAGAKIDQHVSASEHRIALIAVETLAGLPPEEPSGDHAAHERRAGRARIIGAAEKRLAQQKLRVEADEVQKFERPHRIAHAALHRAVDLGGLGDALLRPGGSRRC